MTMLAVLLHGLLVFFPLYLESWSFLKIYCMDIKSKQLDAAGLMMLNYIIVFDMREKSANVT